MNRRKFLRQATGALSGCAATVGALKVAAPAQSARREATGPLGVHPDNPRYFTDSSGDAVYLTGSHTWADFQERAYPETPTFDFNDFLDFLVSYNHNFLRLWRWEHARWMQFTERPIRYLPHPYPRAGPGKAKDGVPKFDLDRFHQPYFDRLRNRVRAAGERGIYVAVMLFQGFSIQQKGTRGVDPHKGNPWDGHPFHRQNNVNRVDGDPDKHGEGQAVHTLAIPAITRLQEAYVRKVIDTVGDLDNVLYEISNESHGRSSWLVNILPLVRIDVEEKTAWFAVDPTYRYEPDNPYRVENAIEYLDEPGEWAFNSLEGRIYIWPEKSLRESDIRAPYLQEFIRVEGIEDGAKARFIHIEGLTFRHGLRDTWAEGDKALQHDWEMFDKGNAILRFRHAEDCSVSRCEFSASSGAGVRFDLHCRRIAVSSNLLEHLGGTGIVLSGYGPGTKDDNKCNTVTNNYIHHVGEIPLFLPHANLGTDLTIDKRVVPGKDEIGLLYADPLFDEEAMKKKIFKFKKGSPAEKLGIEPIDLSEVGSSLARSN